MHLNLIFNNSNTSLNMKFIFRNGLKKNGVIVIKENVTSSSKVETDKKDSSVTRPVSLLRRLIKKSGLTIFKETHQTNLPKGLYTVKMFGLRPSLDDSPSDTNSINTDS